MGGSAPGTPTTSLPSPMAGIPPTGLIYDRQDSNLSTGMYA